jgi:hypothetical protein
MEVVTKEDSEATTAEVAADTNNVLPVKMDNSLGDVNLAAMASKAVSSGNHT